MCGRYTLTSPQEVAEHYGVGSVPAFGSRYNIAPSQESLIVTSRTSSGSETREPLPASWGIHLPNRGGSGSRYVINARSEEVAAKPLFRQSFAERRCLVPANGFYEWTKIGNTKQPYYFSLPGGALFSFAGLWSLDQENRPTYVILTTTANATVAPIHDRMPVIVGPESYSEWLAPGHLAEASAASMSRPWRTEETACWPVRMRVNSPSFDDETCIREQEGPVDLFTY